MIQKIKQMKMDQNQVDLKMKRKKEKLKRKKKKKRKKKMSKEIPERPIRTTGVIFRQQFMKVLKKQKMLDLNNS